MLDGQAVPLKADVVALPDAADVVLGLLRDGLLVEEDDTEREMPAQ